MKIKTTAIAMAVAGTVAAPITVQADASEVYASARVGVEYVDNADIADFNIRSFSSRFGAKGETDLGNGMTGYGHYEWDVDLGADTDGGTIGLRHRYVGVKGDFGNVYVGQTYHAFYNHVVGPADPAYWNSGFAMIDYNGRRDKFVTYASAAGAVSWAVSAGVGREAEEDTPDEIEIGVSFPIGDTTLGLGLHNTAADADDGTGSPIGNSSDEDVVGVMWSGIGIGDASLAVGFQTQDDDTGYNFALTSGGFYFVGEFESIDDDSQGAGAGTDPGGFTLGYEQTLGRKTKMWYEIHSLDADTGDSDDDTTAFQAVLRYDII